MSSSIESTDDNVSAKWPYKPGTSPLSIENADVNVSLVQRTIDALKYERGRKPQPWCLYQ